MVSGSCFVGRIARPQDIFLRVCNGMASGGLARIPKDWTHPYIYIYICIHICIPPSLSFSLSVWGPNSSKAKILSSFIELATLGTGTARYGAAKECSAAPTDPCST